MTNYKRHSRSLLKQFKWTNHKRYYWRLLIQFKWTNHKCHNRSLLIMGSCFWLGPLGHCQNITITQILLGSLNLTEYNLFYSWHSLMTTLHNIHHESVVTSGKSSGPFITLYTKNGNYIRQKFSSICHLVHQKYMLLEWLTLCIKYHNLAKWHEQWNRVILKFPIVHQSFTLHNIQHVRNNWLCAIGLLSIDVEYHCILR